MIYSDDLVHKGQLAILAFLGPPWGINPMTYYTIKHEVRSPSDLLSAWFHTFDCCTHDAMGRLDPLSLNQTLPSTPVHFPGIKLMLCR